MRTGKDSTSFKIKLDKDWFGKIRYNRTKTLINNILYYLGCLPSYQILVLGKPKQIEDGFSYPIKIYTKSYRIFGIKVKTVNYE